MTEFELFKALRALYPPAEYALLPRVANGTGARANRHADALCLSLWPSRGIYLTGFEMKSYRGDWIRELRNPAKAEDIAKFCTNWYIVAGGPFVKVEEVPELWGLMTWDETKKALVKTKPARPREVVEKPDLSFIAGMLRKAQEYIGPEAEIAVAREESFAKGKEAGEKGAGWEAKALKDLKQKVADFEKASGINLNHRWEDGKTIGQAVEMVLKGTESYQRKSLIRVAKQILKDLGSDDAE